MQHEDRSEIRQLMRKHFSMGELRGLVFELQGVEFDDVPGETKDEKIVGLIEYLERRDKEDELLRLLTRERPEAAWPDLQPPGSAHLIQASTPASPGFGQLALGDKTVAEVVHNLDLMFDNHEPELAGALPAGLLPEIGRLFGRYTYCTPPEACHTQVWGTRLLSVVETHKVLTRFDRYLFQSWLMEKDKELQLLRADMREIADALRDYGQALTSYFKPALDWQQVTVRLEEDGYEALWNLLDARKEIRESLSDEVRQRCNQSFWQLREALDSFEALQARC